MKNNIKVFIFFAFLFAAFLAFGTQTFAQTKNEILIVADQKTSCRGIVAQDCLQVKHLNEEKFNILRQSIDGFRYMPGFYYVLDVRSGRTGYRLQRVLAQVRSDEIAQPVPLAAPQDLSGIEWKLTRVDGNSVNSDKAVIRFDEQNNRARGNGGCNSFGGSLTKNSSEIEITRIISTKMACVDQSKMRIENTFFRNLERVTSYQISGNKLMLMAGRTTVLEFMANR